MKKTQLLQDQVKHPWIFTQYVLTMLWLVCWYIYVPLNCITSLIIIKSYDQHM